MPIRIKTDLEWGDTWYIKNDPKQLEYNLVGLEVRPGSAIKFILSYMGDEYTVHDFECSKEKDILKNSSEDSEDSAD